MSNTSHLRNLKIASISDIHLGHNKNVAADIIKNLEKAFPDNAETASLDIIFIVGDVFDTLMFLSADDVGFIKLWIAKLLRIAAKYNIIVRVLEGTPSHDRKQSLLFPLINSMAEINADVRHITEIYIEHIEKHNINVLYVPDEATASPEKTYEQIIDLMCAKGLSQVDFALMHGAFNYQLHPAAKAPRHSEEQYLSIVKEYIFVGHIHHYSTYKRIIAQGSFDRLCHGEEEEKGHVRVSYDSEGSRKIKFIPNKNSRIFKTINCTNLEVPAILEKVEQILIDLPANAFVRIEAEKDNPIFTSFDVLIRQFPLVTWSKKPNDDDDEIEEINIVEDEDNFTPITITSDNIVSLIYDRLIKQNVNDQLRERCNSLLLEVL